MATLSQAQAQSTPKVLVYTATAGYRHDSIPTAIEVLDDNAQKYGVEFTFSEDKSLFTEENLATYDGVMFVSNSDEVLDSSGQAALQKFFQSGGVYTGVHAASACLFNDTNYQQAVGALFDYHPPIQDATFTRLNDSHPATADVPDRWSFQEEVYYFRSNPRDNGAVVIMSVDETSYVDNGTSTGDYPSMGDPHPIAWYIDQPLSSQPLAEGVSKPGRSFYTSLGHLNSTWQNETFINHVMAGLKWALDGGSTKAYGVGLVGNGDGSNSTSFTSAVGNSATSSGQSASSTTGGGSATSSAGGSASSAASSGATSSAGHAIQLDRRSMGLGIGMIGAVGVGVGLVL
ncbi:glycosyl-hydrolase [Kwoniella mangroviensis CBS 10435]|uniref:Glycosyl-hydrolase n=1 Tax=Kwoniella mangroviensis CBS 10435 TaxID=1331196 RepID=A0A1B9J0G4_9TREE|nr:glycosyl-hydrolase [Kwoniella mangroviensis CBS 10435]